MCLLILNGCSPNVKKQTQATSNQPNVVVTTPNVGTNAEPEKIIIYNKGRTATFEKGTTTFEVLKSNVYTMINEKTDMSGNIIKSIITNELVSEFKQQLTVEFLYSTPVEFIYPSGQRQSKEMITKFLVAPAAGSHTVITAPANPKYKGVYANGLFVVQLDSSYEKLLLKRSIMTIG